MTTRSWIRKVFVRTPRTVRKAPPRYRLAVEALEDRTVPATFTQVTGALNPFSGINGGSASNAAPALADVDGDSDLDLVLGVAGLIKYFKNTGTATKPVYAEQTGTANPFRNISLANRAAPTLGDIDGDGDLDVVEGLFDGTLRYGMNLGTATNPIYQLQTGAANPFNGFDVGNGSKPSVGDLDGDGDLDLIVGADDGTLRYWTNTGTATNPVFAEQTGAANPVSGFSVGLRAAPTLRDLDGDGALDLIVGAMDGTLHYWKNTGAATSPAYAEQAGAANPFIGFDVGNGSTPTVGDIDGDGDLDLSAGELDRGTVLYFRQDDPATFLTPVSYSAGDTSSSVAVGDFNGDGTEDLAVANADSGDVSVLLGDGHGAFHSAVNYAVGSSVFSKPLSVAVGDFNDDGNQDLVTANYGSSEVSVLLGDGHGTFQSAVNSTINTVDPIKPSFLAVGDFNGDDKQDLVMNTNYILNSVTVMRGRGDGSFQSGVQFPADVSNVRSVAVGDFNGDGRQDLAVAGEESDVTVLLGSSVGNFQSLVQYHVTGNAVSVAIGDFNGDGKQDLATANYLYGGVSARFSNSVSVLLGNGNGAFQTAINYSLRGGNGEASSVAVGDFFNSDGSQDLAVLDRSGEVVVLRGDGHGTFAEVGEFTTQGNNAGPLVVGDFNGDGKQDLAATASRGVSVLLSGDDSAPFDILLEATTIAENQAAGTAVGDLYARDLDSDRSFTYELVSVDGTTSNLPFALGAIPNAGSALIGAQLKTVVSFDYEAKSSYSIRVRATDPGGAFLEKEFVINLINVNDESPTDIGLNNSSIAENQPAGTSVGTFSTTDLDGGSHTYTLVDGVPDNTAFVIDGNQLKTAATFNFEGKSLYSIRVRSTDVGLFSTEKVFTINVTNVNETPYLNGQTLNLDEESAAGMEVGYPVGSDPDAGQKLTYSILSGNTNNAFDIDPMTGRLTVANAAALDYETTTSFTLTIQATDNGSPNLSTTAQVVIQLKDVVETPSMTDVSMQIALTRGGYKYNRTTALWEQAITLKNSSTTSISGTIQFVVENLTPGVTLATSTDYVVTNPSVGRYLVTIPKSKLASLGAGQRYQLNLLFSNPLNKTVTYDWKVFTTTVG